MPSRIDAIVNISQALARSEPDAARHLAETEYPFRPESITKRVRRPLECTRVFVRDGFIDRYAGTRLVFLPALRLISLALPAEFPYHPNWKTDVTHPAYWELAATLDHVEPVARGGADDESNWVTTSMARNFAKQHSTLGELGW